MKKLSLSQIKTLVNLQNDMNSKVDPNWIAANNAWFRAIHVESVEAIEHHGWKWWKKQVLDLPQLQMELVDIWHFMLSVIIQSKDGNIEQAIDTLKVIDKKDRNEDVFFDEKKYIINELTLLEKLDLMAGLASAKRINVSVFEALLEDCQMDWDDLYRQYVGKNILNMFRQDNGYKAGTYIKIWGSLEDNDHLIKAMDEIDTNADDFSDLLYQALHARYKLFTIQVS
jgi:dimeric dUTPase (all-alpha-NTP-PPase superfamily)